MTCPQKICRGIFLTVLCATIFGCANYVWMKNGQPAGQVEFDRDSMYCTERSVSAFPSVTTTVITENRKYVNKGNVCAYNPKTFRNECGDTVEVVPEKTQQRDANESARNNHKWTCMGSLGWAQHQVKKEMAATEVPTRSDNELNFRSSCSIDNDCSGNLRCIKGVCERQSDKYGVCGKPSDCSGLLVCRNNVCVDKR